jgi:hypothetical protein
MAARFRMRIIISISWKSDVQLDNEAGSSAIA